MAEPLTTTAEVIDALGGNQPVQELTAAKWPQTVSNWRGFETFPSHTYVVMTEALARLGKSAPASLWGMTAAQDQPPTENAVAS